MKGRIKKRVSFLLACSMMFGCFPNSSVAYAMETQTEMLAEETNTTTYELKVGETIKIEGEEIEIVSEENAENISCVKTAGWQKVLDQDTLEDGKYFIGTIINGGGSNYSGDAEAFLKLEGETPSLTKATSEWWEKSDFEIPYVWNVKRIEENKYTMQSQDNKYLHLHTNGVGMSDEEKYVDIASRFLNSDYRNDDCPDAQNVYVVTNGQVFLNYQGHTSGGVYAKTGKGIWSAWYLYRVKDIIEITAQKAGTVDIMIDEVPYTITVLDERPVLEALVAEVESENYKQENYTLSSWNTYVQALEEARNLLGDNSATYDVLYDARIALETARDGLTEKSKVLIPVDAITATGNQENNNQSASQVLDEEDSTIWHTQHSGIKSYDNLWIQFELDSTYEVYSLKYKPRSGAGNGTIKKYTVMTSDDGVNWNTVSEGFWTEDGTNTGSINDNEKEAIFKVPTCTKYVRLKAENAVSDNTNGYVFASAAKIRLYGIRVVDFTEVDKAIATAEALDRNLYTTESLIAVDQAMEAAKAADRKQEYTEEAQEATNALASAINAGLAALEVEELAFSGAYVSLHDDISVHYVFNKEVFEKAGYRDIEIDFEFNNKTTSERS